MWQRGPRAVDQITLTGVALVKTLLKHFDTTLLAQVLKASEDTIGKVACSHLLKLAPMLSNEDGLVLVEILEERMEEMGLASDDEVPASRTQP